MEERDQLLNAAKQPSQRRTGNRPLNLAITRVLVSLTVREGQWSGKPSLDWAYKKNRKRAGGSQYRQLSKGAESGGNSLVGDAEPRE